MKAKTKLYATLAVFILIAFALAFFLAYPTLNDIKRHSEEISSTREDYLSMYLQHNEVEQFKVKSEIYKESLKKIDGMFIDPKNPVDFVRFLEKSASDLGVTAEINLANKDKSATDTSNSYFKITTEGDFVKILTFTQQLESGPYLVRLETLSMSNATEAKDEKKPANVVSANMLLSVANK